MAIEGDFASIDGDSRAVEKISMALEGDFASIDGAHSIGVGLPCGREIAWSWVGPRGGATRAGALSPLSLNCPLFFL